MLTEGAVERLSAVTEDVERRCGFTVAVQWDSDRQGAQARPRPGAAPFSWLLWGDELIVSVGDGKCRWELSTDAEDVTFAEAVIRAVVAGRVTEVFGPSRSRLTVQLSDGSPAVTSQASLPRGCLPVPSWIRRGRLVHYQPYVADR